MRRGLRRRVRRLLDLLYVGDGDGWGSGEWVEFWLLANRLCGSDASVVGEDFVRELRVRAWEDRWGRLMVRRDEADRVYESLLGEALLVQRAALGLVREFVDEGGLVRSGLSDSELRRLRVALDAANRVEDRVLGKSTQRVESRVDYGFLDEVLAGDVEVVRSLGGGESDSGGVLEAGSDTDG